MQPQDRPDPLPSAAAASPSVPAPSPRRSMLRPSSFRSRVRGTLSRGPAKVDPTGAARSVDLVDSVTADLVAEAAASIDRVLAGRAVEPLFQPIVELDGLRTVGVEALARGPAGTDLWHARALFAAAVQAGRLAELDTLCAERALEIARDAPTPPPLVFVNAEPAVMDQPLSSRLLGLMSGGLPFRIVLEYTERALTARPAALLQIAAAVEAFGNYLALDDVGADPMSLAFLPLLEPEIVKLDLHLLRAPHAPRTVDVVAAVCATAERTGAVIIAEGIETAADLANARALGAHWGQGLLIGGPAPITQMPPPDPDAAAVLRAPRPGLHLPTGTPFEAAAARGKTRPGTPEAFAARLDHVLRRVEAGSVVLAWCTDPATAASWLLWLTAVADRAAFTGLVAPVSATAAPPLTVPGGLRLATGPRTDVEECAVVVVGPRYTAALCARGGPSSLAFAHTEERDLVAEMARIVLQRLPR
jgi:EAL domain-containing protein (putative c-di-GMP-specific phosphodiesterase class I)